MTKPVIVTRTGKGSALTFQEGDDNFTNLQNATITVSDGTSSTAIDLNGTITFTAGTAISIDEVSGTVTVGFTGVQATGNELENVVEDTTPQLGGNLDVNGSSIVSTSNGNIAITPNGTGSIVLDGVNWPQADGTANYVLKTNGSGQLSWTNTVDGTNEFGYRDLPAVGTKTSSYTLATADVGKYVQVGSGGSITIPDATFAEGDALVIANNHSAAITITCSITTAYIAGTDADKASVSLATRGVATVLFLSGTVCIISGNVS